MFKNILKVFYIVVGIVLCVIVAFISWANQANSSLVNITSEAIQEKDYVSMARVHSSFFDSVDLADDSLIVKASENVNYSGELLINASATYTGTTVYQSADSSSTTTYNVMNQSYDIYLVSPVFDKADLNSDGANKSAYRFTFEDGSYYDYTFVATSSINSENYNDHPLSTVDTLLNGQRNLLSSLSEYGIILVNLSKPMIFGMKRSFAANALVKELNDLNDQLSADPENTSLQEQVAAMQERVTAIKTLTYNNETGITETNEDGTQTEEYKAYLENVAYVESFGGALKSVGLVDSDGKYTDESNNEVDGAVFTFEYAFDFTEDFFTNDLDGTTYNANDYVENYNAYLKDTSANGDAFSTYIYGTTGKSGEKSLSQTREENGFNWEFENRIKDANGNQRYYFGYSQNILFSAKIIWGTVGYVSLLLVALAMLYILLFYFTKIRNFIQNRMSRGGASAGNGSARTRIQTKEEKMNDMYKETKYMEEQKAKNKKNKDVASDFQSDDIQDAEVVTDKEAAEPVKEETKPEAAEVVKEEDAKPQETAAEDENKSEEN